MDDLAWKEATFFVHGFERRERTPANGMNSSVVVHGWSCIERFSISNDGMVSTKTTGAVFPVLSVVKSVYGGLG